MEQFSILAAALERLLQKERYPFHMPGHKRRLEPTTGLPYAADLTEVDGSDDLHDAEGILREAMERTARLCGAERTWYLVGGSTCGNLAAIRAAAPYGSEVIAARNCHKSVYHAIELGNLNVHWITPPLDAAFGIYGSVPPQEVAALLARYPRTRAVILTSPTYEGVVSDICSIAEICHRRKNPAALLVDEAHGAHLGLRLTEKEKEQGSAAVRFFPESAVSCGADLVVQSAHKTLPSLTQTALLHVGAGRLDRIVMADEVERQLDVFETSSPSYPLMTALDGCTGLLRAQGAALFAQWEERLRRFDEAARGLSGWRFLCHGGDTLAQHPTFFDFDPGKILFRRAATAGAPEAGAEPCGASRVQTDRDGGPEAAETEMMLRERFHIELEMRCGDNLLAMTSCADAPDALGRLLAALREMAGDGREAAAKRLSEAGENAAQSTWTVGALSDRPTATGRKAANRPEEPAASARADDEKQVPLPPPGPVRCTIAEAVRLVRESGRFLSDTSELPAGRPYTVRRFPAAQAVGQICGEYLWAYPPGVPVIAPGEEVTEPLVAYLRRCGRQGTELKHSGRRPAPGEEDRLLCITGLLPPEK